MKKLLVTDPCYLISDDDWSNVCSMCFNKELEENKALNKFNEMITELLKLNSGDDKAIADRTGFGDWVNSIDGKMFYADSGMVCVVEDTEKLRNYLLDKGIDLPTGVAHLEVEDDAHCNINTDDPTWSVVEISSGGKLIRSETH